MGKTHENCMTISLITISLQRALVRLSASKTDDTLK